MLHFLPARPSCQQFTVTFETAIFLRLSKAPDSKDARSYKYASLFVCVRGCSWDMMQRCEKTISGDFLTVINLSAYCGSYPKTSLTLKQYSWTSALFWYTVSPIAASVVYALCLQHT